MVDSKGMDLIAAPPRPLRTYEVVADCHIAGRSFSRGERPNEQELGELRPVLLTAGLLREVSAASRD